MGDSGGQLPQFLIKNARDEMWPNVAMMQARQDADGREGNRSFAVPLLCRLVSRGNNPLLYRLDDGCCVRATTATTSRKNGIGSVASVETQVGHCSSAEPLAQTAASVSAVR